MLKTNELLDKENSINKNHIRLRLEHTQEGINRRFI